MRTMKSEHRERRLTSGTLIIVKHDGAFRATFVRRDEAAGSVAACVGCKIDDLAGLLWELTPDALDRAFRELHAAGATRVGFRNARYESLVRYGLLRGNGR